MTQRKRRKAGKRPNGRLPGWVHMFAGLSIGLAVALGIYVNDRQQLIKQPAALPAPAQPAPVAAPAAAEPAPAEAVEDAGVSFDFYDMLPNLDVEIFQDERKQKPVAAKPAPARVASPGIYIIQAGSFSGLADADRRKAQMALLGIRADIKRGNVNGRTVYRVYTDALESPADVNRLSDQLSDAGIEILVKRVSD